MRLVKGRYDLDLSYITENIIAMQFPAVGIEAVFRNPRHGEQGVVSYLEEQHGIAVSYLMSLNLCALNKTNHYNSLLLFR